MVPPQNLHITLPGLQPPTTQSLGWVQDIHPLRSISALQNKIKAPLPSKANNNNNTETNCFHRNQPAAAGYTEFLALGMSAFLHVSDCNR